MMHLLILPPKRNQTACYLHLRATRSTLPLAISHDVEVIEHGRDVAFANDRVDFESPWWSVAKELDKVQRNRFASDDGLTTGFLIDAFGRKERARTVRIARLP